MCYAYRKEKIVRGTFDSGRDLKARVQAFVRNPAEGLGIVLYEIWKSDHTAAHNDRHIVLKHFTQCVLQ